MKITETAYFKYLASVGPQNCFNHILECIKQGGEDNMVWELLEHYGEGNTPYLKAAEEVTIKIYKLHLQAV